MFDSNGTNILQYFSSFHCKSWKFSSVCSCFSNSEHLFLCMAVLLHMFFFFWSNMSSRKCKNDHEKICHICGNFYVIKRRQNIMNFVKKSYNEYSRMKLGDLDKKKMGSRKVCHTCVEQLRKWKQGNEWKQGKS